MPNAINKKFNFGFLNDAQDATDIAPNEGVVVESVDADQLALGTLQSGTYLAGTLPVPDPNDTAVLGSRNFKLAVSAGTAPATPGNLFFEEDSVTPAGVFQPVNNLTNPPKGSVPSLAAGINPSVITGPINDPLAPGPTPGITGMQARIAPGTQYVPSSSVDVWQTEIIGVGPDLIGHVINGGAPGLATAFAPDVFFQFNSNGSNLEVLIPAAYTVVLTDKMQITISTVDLPPDGDYVYIFVNVQTPAGAVDIKPAQDIQGLPSDTAVFSLNNFDAAGVKVADILPDVTFPTAPAYTDEIWCFRKGPNDDAFVRIARYEAAGDEIFKDDAPSTSIAGKTFTDTGSTSRIVNLILLDSEKDESFADINVAIGNTSGKFIRLFEKDNRLWLQPEDRPDLLIFSRGNDWWGWQRSNAFAFSGDTNTGQIVDITFTRDQTVVGGEFTMVVFTTDGIFHITGNGSQDSPYKLITAIRNINVAQNSVVDMNGLIMFTTVADAYDDGPYGRKIYEYDLQKVIEVSGRIKNSAFIASTDAIEFAVMRGSDKYLVKKFNEDKAVLFHRKVRGWIELIKLAEDNGSYIWKSKNFTPEIFDRFKIAGARKFKIDMIGALILTFNVFGPDQSLAPQAFAFVLVSDGSGTNRTELIRRLPALKGRKWNMQVETPSSAIVFDFYLVV